MISPDRFNRIRRGAQTSVSLGAGFQKIFNFYDVTSITAAYGFDIKSNNKRTVFKQLGVGLFLYNIEEDFLDIIQNNILILKSLDNNLFTGFLFNELSLVWTKPKDKLFAGFAVPYYNDAAVPFIKQFHVGGPNGIRAWQPRELGPGSHITNTPVIGNLFYQTGDFKLEWNLEYRTDLFYVFEGALFVDAGNVWTLKDDIARPGSRFGADFFTQIAVGAGYGIRIDFNYFNLRFDFGYKVLNPFVDPDTGSRWVSLRDQSRLGNVNVAINYPF